MSMSRSNPFPHLSNIRRGGDPGPLCLSVPIPKFRRFDFSTFLLAPNPICAICETCGFTSSCAKNCKKPQAVCAILWPRTRFSHFFAGVLFFSHQSTRHQRQRPIRSAYEAQQPAPIREASELT